MRWFLLETGKSSTPWRRRPHIQQLIGKRYDYDFIPKNDAYYCSEIVTEFFEAALEDKAPRFSANGKYERIGKYEILKRLGVLEPTNLLGSPDLEVVSDSR